MTNKEMAVQLYCAFLNTASTIVTHSTGGKVQLPSSEDMVAEVEKLTNLLKNVKD